MIYIGIDPGKTGGISGIYNDKQIITFMMTTEALINYQLCSIARWSAFDSNAEPKFGYIGQEPVKAIIEAQHAFPGMSAKGQWSFAQHYGFIRGCLVSLDIPFVEVSPQKWMPYFGFKRLKDEDKKKHKLRILQKAQNLFPNSSVALQTADSLMLAEYLRLTDRS